MRGSPAVLGYACLCALAAGAADDAVAAEVESSATPYPGVVYTVYAELSIPARIHVARIDLTRAELTLLATSEGQRGLTPSAYSADSQAQVVINGDFFSPVDFGPAGLAMGDAVLWSGTSDDDVSGFVSFDKNGNRSHVRISPPEDVVDAATLEVGTQGVIGGRPLLVRTGLAVTAFDCTDLIALPCDRAPRTAVGLSEDGNTMWLAVVDGWQLGSLGMTAAELGTLLDSLGAYDALMLDGGGAAEMYITAEGGVVSNPSDGVERVVANHLGVRFGSLPPGNMVGLIRERDIFDTTADIDGALAELDDGVTSVVTGADGRYNFASVSPRYACVTASKAGYHSTTRCQQVVSGELVFNSIALFPNSDFVDAAPGAPDGGDPDAATPIVDAGAGSPDAIGPDAGGDGGGKGCSTRRDDSGPGPGGSLLTLALATLLVVRRSRIPS